jgi:peptidoglycan/xylan/chitin deacetylase (PgdA/CDA1 family)
MVVSANRTPRVVAVNWAKKALKLALLGPAMIGRDDGPGLYVLIYHRVGAGQGREMDMPVHRFARQMRELTNRGALVGLREGLDRLSTGDLQRDLVAVTFDDGYHEVYEHAWPILRDLQVPATVFLPTAFTEGTGPPPIRAGAADRGAPARPLSWEEVGEMVSTGLLTVGSHSVTHTDFDRLSRAQADEEAGASRALLETRTGATVDLFAYPRAVVAHEEIVASHYRYAVAADGAKNRSGTTDPRRVMRTPVRDSDGMFFFRRRLEGMRPLEDRLYANLRGRAP